MPAPTQTKKLSRKCGRNAKRCLAYKSSQRREFNKARRLIHYLRKWPTQADAAASLEKLKGVLFGAQKKALGLT
jgi:hypothetical protein